MSKIKLCGMTREEDIEAVNEAKPDFCGFVIEVEKSRRNVTEARARRLIAGLAPGIIPVGVFVNAPEELPARLLMDGTLGFAQLHGQEGEAYIRSLQEKTGKPVIRAFSVRTAEDVKRAAKSSADYVLLDQGSGGTGRSFDWSLIQKLDRPFFLAGGLGTENLEQAVREIRPWAVDLSSSLETEGKKDRKRILEAVALVRRATEENGRMPRRSDGGVQVSGC